jgi:hypothetical protein
LHFSRIQLAFVHVLELQHEPQPVVRLPAGRHRYRRYQPTDFRRVRDLLPMFPAPPNRLCRHSTTRRHRLGA